MGERQPPASNFPSLTKLTTTGGAIFQLGPNSWLGGGTIFSILDPNSLPGGWGGNFQSRTQLTTGGGRNWKPIFWILFKKIVVERFPPLKNSGGTAYTRVPPPTTWLRTICDNSFFMIIVCDVVDLLMRTVLMRTVYDEKFKNSLLWEQFMLITIINENSYWLVCDKNRFWCEEL